MTARSQRRSDNLAVVVAARARMRPQRVRDRDVTVGVVARRKCLRVTARRTRNQRTNDKPVRLRVVVVRATATHSAQGRMPPPVDVVSGETPATAESARNRTGWIVLPRFVARPKMPSAAVADSQYFSGEVGSSTSCSVNSEDEHTPSALRHSEETAVESPPAHAVPEVGQRSKHDSEVPTAVAREETWNVLEENGSGSNSLDEAAGVEEEAGAIACESSSLAGDADILAGESSDEEIRNGDCVKPPGSVSDGDTSISRSSRRWFDTKSRHVRETGDAGESGCEHIAPPRVSFALQHDGSAGALDSEVEATDA